MNGAPSAVATLTWIVLVTSPHCLLQFDAPTLICSSSERVRFGPKISTKRLP